MTIIVQRLKPDILLTQLSPPILLTTESGAEGVRPKVKRPIDAKHQPGQTTVRP